MPQAQTLLNRQIEATDRQIDRLVYITEEEKIMKASNTIAFESPLFSVFSESQLQDSAGT